MKRYRLKWTAYEPGPDGAALIKAEYSISFWCHPKNAGSISNAMHCSHAVLDCNIDIIAGGKSLP